MALHDPDLQPLDRVVKLRLSRRQLRDVDRLAAEFSMTRAWFLREGSGHRLAGGGGQAPHVA